MNILLAGQKTFGRDTLELIISLGHTISAVSCPVGTDFEDRLFIAAKNHGLPIIPSGTLTAETMPENVDLIIAAHSHDFIGRKTRDRARFGAIGYHPSLLPLYRGRDAIRWAIKLRERVTGGTVYWLDDNVDAGPIAAQEHVFISPGDDAGLLWRRDLAPLGLRLFKEVLQDIASGSVCRIEQDESLATWYPACEGVPRLRRPDLPRLGSNGIEFKMG